MRNVLIFLEMFLVVSFAQSQTIRYVRPVLHGSGNGSSWANASNDLQAMINSSSAGDEVWVAEGTYYPLQDISDDGNVYAPVLCGVNTYCDSLVGSTNSRPRLKSFLLKADVRIYGGFPDNGSAVWTDRDWNANPTILSGDIGIPNDNTDNCYHVVISVGSVDSACLDGFTITKGDGNNPEIFHYLTYNSGLPASSNIFIYVNGIGVSESVGAGIVITNSSPTLANLIISENSVHGHGGGMSIHENSSPLLTNVTINENTAFNGGGMYSLSSSPVLTNVTIIENHARSNGGGIFSAGINPSLVLMNVTIGENHAIGSGGGILSTGHTPSLSLMNVTISGNLADGNGGGIYGDNLSYSPLPMMLTNVIITGNVANSNGGGMYNDGASSLVLTNVIITGNRTGGGSGDGSGTTFSGGGIYNYVSSPILTNVTISGNYATGNGGGMANDAYSEPIVRNSIIWGNDAIIDKNVSNANPANPTYYHSIVERNVGFGGLWDATLGIDSGNNLPCDANPRFINPVPAANAPTTAGDYRLGTCSPAIDAGFNAYNPILTDVDENPRIHNGIIDLGGYEYQLRPPPSMLHSSNTTVCYKDTAILSFAFTGTSPWQLVYTKDNGINYDTIKSISDTLHWRVSPSDSTLYKFINVIDSNCVFDISDSIQVNVFPNPTVDNVLENDTLCNEETTQSVVFSGTATSFEWVASGDSINSIPAGIQMGNFGSYVVENESNTPLTSHITVTPIYTENGQTCFGADSTFSITVYPHPTLTNTLSNDTLCSGETTNSVVFTGNANLYEWVAGGNNINNIPTGIQTGNFGTYIVENEGNKTLTSRITVTPTYTENGRTCFGTDTVFSIVVNPLPNAVINQTENVLITNGEGGNQYQWYFNGTPIPDATEVIYTCTQDGVYFVVITNKYGCVATSESVIIKNLSIANITQNGNIRVYPNPTTGKFSVLSSQFSEMGGEVEIFDVVGKQYNVGAKHVLPNEEIEIDISHLANGLYFLKIDGKVFKVVKR